jgi:methyl-accepting chemotaxis protein
MKTVAVETTKLAAEYIPEVDVAASIQGASNRIMYAMRGYGFTEDEMYLNGALESLEEMDGAILKGQELAKMALNLQGLTGQLEHIENQKTEYRMAMEATRSTVAELRIAHNSRIKSRNQHLI